MEDMYIFSYLSLRASMRQKFRFKQSKTFNLCV